ncbi:hypothetical protein [Bacillus sp. AG4(2022)]|uniref:hypothetical protein n=1 Tax=Bacillus sp. AG4(2022) TaxID=2962594 RepID=UPI002880C336|nr:hypothetical protein [Bacillus sp. AG4(2022)]MDT0160391.1 hypothetical protein [Bacillus sp. AG4(2022)]
MLLQDTLGWVRRNLKNMNDIEKQKMLKEVKQMEYVIEKELNNIKPKEANQYVG